MDRPIFFVLKGWGRTRIVLCEGRSGARLHLNQEHAHRSLGENAVGKHGWHIDEGARLGGHRIRAQLDVGLALKEIEDGRGWRRVRGKFFSSGKAEQGYVDVIVLLQDVAQDSFFG